MIDSSPQLLTGLLTDEEYRAQMSSADINNLPDSDFAYIEPGGTKDASGKTVPRSKRHFPIHDAAHVRNALARLSGSPFEKQARPKVEAAARKMGIGEPAARSDRPTPPRGLDLVRVTQEYRILTRADGFGDGRTVEAIITPFNSPTYILDRQGEYDEKINQHAFDRILERLRPQGRRTTWNVPIFYNHGMTLHGTPSESGSLAYAVPLDIRADANYLISDYRVLPGERGDIMLDLLAAGAVGHSFTGRIMRSNPEPGSSGYRRGRNGELTLVERLELGLKEFGATPIPAYDDTHALSIRSDTPDAQKGPSEDEDPDAPDGSSEEEDGGTPSDDGLVSGALLDEHAARPTEDEDGAARHAAFVTRLRREGVKRGITAW